ncbi:MAG: transposase [Verrucomicrobiae bacterium]|nr:transposase [Verrucomicrobiae bacterium]
MARPIRIEFEGAIYHITARGNERRAIFHTELDRSIFLTTLAEMVERFAVILYGYCLMGNHYHLILETPRGNLSRALGWLQTTYTVRFNRRHHRNGHLFQGRFKAHLVEADEHARALVEYVHLNPVRMELEPGDPLPPERESKLTFYPWSSHRAYAGLDRAPKWLNLNWLSYFGRNRRIGQREYVQRMHSLFGDKLSRPWDNLQHGLVLGGPEILERVEHILSGKKGIEETAWLERWDNDERQKARQNTLLAKEPDMSLKIWLRVRLDGERAVDVGRELGHRSRGAAVGMMIRRLEERTKTDQSLRRKMERYRRMLRVESHG